MPRTKLAAARSIGLTVVLMAAVTMLASGFAGDQAARGKETIKIVSTKPGPWHPPVTARGAFRAKGFYIRKKGEYVFPHGKLSVHRHLRDTTVAPPNLRTCVFTAKQTGTFRIYYSTGWYAKDRYSGDFWSYITGRLKQTGTDQCGSRIVSYRAVTYEIGTVP